jgi:predicted lysophospholipase L1 biosynthesis ABC-type transport system permease subunit
MLNVMLLPLAAEESSAGAWPWVIGGGALLLLLLAMMALLAFGRGREHS